MTPHVDRPIATIDLAIFGLTETGLAVLQTCRAEPPFAGVWALPGGWIHIDEDADLDAAARRILAAKTGVATPYLEQLATRGSATRDPRGWSLSVTYIALLRADDVAAAPGPGTTDTRWTDIDGPASPLAFDHAAILAEAVARLRAKVEYSTLPAHLLPREFTLTDLQGVYERVLGRRLDKSAFRKRVAEAAFALPITGAFRLGSNRPAQLYRLANPQGLMLFDRTI